MKYNIEKLHSDELFDGKIMKHVDSCQNRHFHFSFYFLRESFGAYKQISRRLRNIRGQTNAWGTFGGYSISFGK